MRTDETRPVVQRAPEFTTTRWSVVLAAGGSDSHQAATALETLCRTYWYPLYAYARRCGQSAADAEDSVQSFFARFLGTNGAGMADRNRGRFRSYLLIAFKRFLANEWDRHRARKRGGGQVIAWESLEAEQRYALEPADVASPDRLFDRRWAMTVLTNVLNRLETEQVPARRAVFAALKPALTGGNPTSSYADLGRQLGMNEGAVKVAIHRLRQRYRQLLEEEISHTLARTQDIAAERRHLLQALMEP